MWPALAALFFFQTADHIAEGTKALDDGKYDVAVAAFRKAAAAEPKDYVAHFHLALAYSMLDRDTEAISEYRLTLELQPGLFEAGLNLGILYLRGKEPAEALPLLEHAAEQKPREFRPRYFAAEAQLQTGALDGAEESFRLALELDPKSADAQLGMARALARQSKLDAAIPHYRQAGQVDSKYRESLLELATLYEENQRPADAVTIYREFPENASAQQRLGALMLQDKQYVEAIPRLESAYVKEPTAANRAALAAAYVFTSKLEKALPLLETSVGAEPNDYDLRMLYARALRDRRQFSAAAAQFQQAARLKPSDAKTWNELGNMLYMAGALPQSLAAFDRARDLGENTAGNWFLRAIILDKLKQPKPALDAYQQFLAKSQGAHPDQEFQARQRSKILKRELEKR